MSTLSVLFSATMVAQTIRMTVPYACAALGGILSERSGVVNIALEGVLLSSALAAVAVNHATGSAVAGVFAGAACGAAVGALHATLVVRGRIDAIVSGIGINLAAVGGTRFLLRALYGSSANSPNVNAFRFLEGFSALPRALLDPFLLLTVGCMGGLAWTLARTRFGLRLRACGEDPSAAEALGIRVGAVRTVAVSLGGAVCGLGGTAHAYDLHQFQAEMTGGRGFLALAAVIVSGWRPWAAGAACLMFAALDALQIVLQNQTRVPAEILAVLPYVATLAALVVVSRRDRSSQPPAGLGQHPT